jgi:hypothetical protein
MEPEAFAGNSSINNTIYDCLQHLDQANVTRVRDKLRLHARADDKKEFFHTFRELILGSYLARHGFRLHGYRKYGQQDPDWSVMDERGTPAALIEITNFHAANKTEAQINADLAASGWAYPDVDEADLSLRFHQAIWKKCRKYKELAKSLNVPYVVGCYCFFNNPVERSIVFSSLHAADSGLFRGGDDDGYPDVSGLVVYDEKSLWGPPGTVAYAYVFECFSNPHAVRPFVIPPGHYYPPLSINKRKHYQLLVRFLSEEIDQPEYFRLLDDLLRSDQST